MTIEQNKRLVRRFAHQLSEKNLEATVAACSPDLQTHGAPPGTPGGIEGARQCFTMFLNSFPDLQITTENMIAEGDRVVECLTAWGTHTGVFMGIHQLGNTSLGVSSTFTGLRMARWPKSGVRPTSWA